MDTIAIVDTAISTDNLGDEIIMDAVNGVIWDLFPGAYIVRVPSHEALSDRTRKFVREARWCFIGGTNLLSSDIQPWGLWRLDRDAANAFGSTHTVCLGTGWNDYMSAPTSQTREILSTALSSDLLHSARDSYTRDHLETLGRQALSTSCPTTWSLTPEHCRTIPRSRAPSVVFTLSAWRPDPTADRAFVDLLRRHYGTLYFFPQMQGDYAYFRQFGWDEIEVVATTAEAYTRFLENEVVDFVGTRLHGGIRALQRRQRALILAIDNRATEIGKDIGLPVVARTDIGGIEAWIEQPCETAVTLPQEAIDRWKAQFRGDAGRSVAKPQPLPELTRMERAMERVRRKLVPAGA